MFQLESEKTSPSVDRGFVFATHLVADVAPTELNASHLTRFVPSRNKEGERERERGKERGQMRANGHKKNTKLVSKM